jgi:hypothetical protein
MRYTPRVRTTRLYVQHLGEEVLIYDLEKNEAHCLNASAAQVWSLCDGERTTAEIAKLVTPDLAEEAAEAVVWSALDQLRERHLLGERSAEEPALLDVQAMSRRYMTRLAMTVGLALPMIESIVSPPAALAQSGPLAGCSGSTQFGGATPCEPFPS